LYRLVLLLLLGFMTVVTAVAVYGITIVMDSRPAEAVTSQPY
jgi:hypothetical protein